MREMRLELLATGEEPDKSPVSAMNCGSFVVGDKRDGWCLMSCFCGKGEGLGVSQSKQQLPVIVGENGQRLQDL